MEAILVSLSVLAPHAASELIETILGKRLRDCHWPQVDEALAIGHEVHIAVQVNGKLRGQVTVARGSTQEMVQPLATIVAGKYLEGVQIVKVVFVPDRLISFVVK